MSLLLRSLTNVAGAFVAGFECIASVGFAATVAAIALPEQGAICISFS